MAWHNLARIYAGGGALSPDNNLAYFWARVTASAAADRAQKDFPAFVELLRKRLSLEDAQRTEARAEQWIEEHRSAWKDDGEVTLEFPNVAEGVN